MNVLEKIEAQSYDAKSDYRDRLAYMKEHADLRLIFKADLEEEFDLVGHRKADLLFNKAWQQSHNGGLTEVYHTYGDLAELLD